MQSRTLRAVLFAAAIALDGPKGVGKTGTAARRAAHTVRLDRPGERTVISNDFDLDTLPQGTILFDPVAHRAAVDRHEHRHMRDILLIDPRFPDHAELGDGALNLGVDHMRERLVDLGEARIRGGILGGLGGSRRAHVGSFGSTELSARALSRS